MRQPHINRTITACWSNSFLSVCDQDLSYLFWSSQFMAFTLTLITLSLLYFIYICQNRDAICMSHFCYDHDVRPSVRQSVCLSVTLVDCDHIVQEKIEMGTNRIDRCHIYLHSKADPDCNTIQSRIIQRKISGVWKMCNFPLRRQQSLHPTAHMSRYLSTC